MGTLGTRAIDWLQARKLDPEMAVKLGLESYPAPDGGDEILVIPYAVGDRVVNHKYRGIDQKRFHQDADATKCFFNYNALVDPSLLAEPLIITEGEMDALAAMQCGYQRVVSVPDGAPSKEIPADEKSRKYDYLEHAKAALRECREIILAVDGDEAGQRLLNDLSIRIGKARCKWVPYPKGCKDLNDALIRHGEKGVHEVLRRAQWCRVDGVYRMSELPPYPDREQYRTGFAEFDKHFRVRMGDFTVVTGRPGDGKTTWVTDLLCRLAGQYDWTVAIASFEQHPQSDHRRALREWFCKCPLMDGAGHEIARASDVEAADRWIDEHFVFVLPGDDDLANLSWTLEKCAAAVVRFGARVVVIDPWNELDHDRPPDMSLTEYTGKAIKEFKRLARNLDVHVIVVAHPTKLAGGEKPSLYSISDSAHWANKPDMGIVIYKPSAEGEKVEVTVKKSRYHDQIGKPGTVWMRYERLTRRFEPTSEPVSA